MTETPSTLAALILDNLRGYAVLTLDPQGIITTWLGDSEKLTGFSGREAVGSHFRLLFTAADRAAAAPEAEIATALDQGKAEDSRWHQRADGNLYWANGMTLKLDGGEMLLKIFRDETPMKQADDQRILLLNELNHRVKNTLATVQSVAEQTLRSAGIAKDVRDGLVERLLALGRAHDVLTAENWAGADFQALLQDVVSPYEREPSRFDLRGPPVRLHPSQALTLSMTLHELATNAAKYGALSTYEGRVRVEWNLAQDGVGARYLTILWQEGGGPTVVQPTRTGFGSRLIRQSFAGHPGNRTEMTFEPEGLRCIMVLGLPETAPGGLNASSPPPQV